MDRTGTVVQPIALMVRFIPSKYITTSCTPVATSTLTTQIISAIGMAHHGVHVEKEWMMLLTTWWYTITNSTPVAISTRLMALFQTILHAGTAVHGQLAEAE